MKRYKTLEVHIVPTARTGRKPQFENTTMNAQQFLALASDQSKTFRLEGFSFTFDFGLNIYFDDLDDLQDIVKDTEIEFWQLEITGDDITVDVDNWTALKQVLTLIDDLGVEVGNLAYLAQIVKEGYSTWDQARDWHEDNYCCEAMSDADFGHYLMHEMNCIEVPEALQGYIDYEAYGRDAKINDFVTIDDSIYFNH